MVSRAWMEDSQAQHTMRRLTHTLLVPWNRHLRPVCVQPQTKHCTRVLPVLWTCRSGQVLRLDAQSNPDGYTQWYEDAVAQPDAVSMGKGVLIIAAACCRGCLSASVSLGRRATVIVKTPQPVLPARMLISHRLTSLCHPVYHSGLAVTAIVWVTRVLSRAGPSGGAGS
jgi:hypothetical protein